MSKEYNNLTQLGSQATMPSSPDEAILEKIANPNLGLDYMVRFACPEFTSLCPVTNQPDFAHIVIDYVPDEYIIESKSLKLFLHSFRNHPSFHEACTVKIAAKLIAELRPTWLRIGGYWYPRGGIPIDIFYQTGKKPKHMWIPKQEVKAYRGRG